MKLIPWWESLTERQRLAAIGIAVLAAVMLYMGLTKGDSHACGMLDNFGPLTSSNSAEHIQLRTECDPSWDL